MAKSKLLEKIKRVEKLARTTKLSRFLAGPYKYLNAILYRELVYKNNRKEKLVSTDTFFGIPMNLLLPSSTDIYLTGGKSHSSEIRLAKFLIHNLGEGDSFLDVGAHYGYFSLLSSRLVGPMGRVRAFEASPKTYGILSKNVAKVDHVKANNAVVSNSDKHLTFYEFPNLYSEYNTLDISQYEGQEWYAANPPKEHTIQSVILDDYLVKEALIPNIIKIDVEGAEYLVVSGLQDYLQNNKPSVILEYLSEGRGNEEHIKAEKLLHSMGYKSFTIDADGRTQHVESITDYFSANGIDSDNIVFQKID